MWIGLNCWCKMRGYRKKASGNILPDAFLGRLDCFFLRRAPRIINPPLTLYSRRILCIPTLESRPIASNSRRRSIQRKNLQLIPGLRIRPARPERLLRPTSRPRRSRAPARWLRRPPQRIARTALAAPARAVAGCQPTERALVWQADQSG